MLTSVLAAFQGKKTYVVAGTAILFALLQYQTGALDLQATILAVLGALGLSATRAGSKADAQAVIASRPTNDTTAVS